VIHLCEKNNRRGIRDLFRVYTCDNCLLINTDETITIGMVNIYIYYLNKCEENIIDFAINKKLIQLLYEFILSGSDEILIIEKYNMITKEDLQILLNMDLNIHIIN